MSGQPPLNVGTGVGDGSLVRMQDPELAKTIERARTRILLEQPSLAAAVMRIPVVQIHSDQLPAGIGVARDAIVVSQALRLKDDPWISYAYAHNMIHLLFEHLERRGSRVRSIWDLSIDIATAAMIDPLLSPEVLNYIDYDPRPEHSATFQSLVASLGSRSCEQIYDHLMNQILGGLSRRQANQPSPPSQAGRPASGGSHGQPKQRGASRGVPSATIDGILEDGDPMEMYIRASSDPRRPHASCASSPNPEFEGAPRQSGHAHDIAINLDANTACSDLDRALIIQEVTEALESAGKLPGSEAGRWSELARRARTREVPWERMFAERLSGLVPTDFQTFPFSKRHLWRGVYLPSLARKGVGRVLFAIDTSGSMTLPVLGQIADQIDQLRQATACSLTIVHFDTEIQKISNYDEFQDPIERGVLEMPGRGGTDLRAPFTYASDQMRRGEVFAGAVIATDGCGPLPVDPLPIPTIWLVPDADLGRFKPPFGAVIACVQGGGHAC
jgi:hypothetical protein